MEQATWMVLWALGLLLVASLARRVVKIVRFVRRVCLVPGPRVYPIVGSILPFIVPHNQLVRVTNKFFEDNPPLCMLWAGPMPIITVVKPQHVEVIMGSSKHTEKAFHYKFMMPWLGTGLLTSKGDKWQSHRKLITPTFHFSILEGFIKVFADNSRVLVDKMDKEVGGPGFDVGSYITRCTLDIICETAMGTEISVQQQETDSEYVKAIHSLSEIIMNRIQKPWLYPDFLFRLSSRGRHFRKCVHITHTFTDQVIRERKLAYQTATSHHGGEQPGNKKSRKAFLDLLLEASESGVRLTDEELREEVETFMFEGHDTTTVALVWALHLLGNHPDVQDKALEELRSIFQGSDRGPSMKDLSEMKYLERVIKETLRLYPSVPFIGRTLTEDVVIDGHTIPACVQVVAFLYYTNRDAEHWDNPHDFNPDNFLPQRVLNRHPYAYIPFSAGSRNCIGQKFAMLEVKTVLSYILLRYEVRSLRKDITPLPQLIFRPENGVRISIQRRA